ncbi:MAG: HAD-IIA family hydrolase [Caldilineaceae bacterium]
MNTVIKSSVLRSVRGVLFDMDGVVYVGNRPLPGVQTMLDALEEKGYRWLFVTNNASLTAEQFAEKVAKMGIRATPDHILGSADATASWLAEQVREHGWPQGKVIMNGMEGLRTALVEAGFELTGDPFEATYAVSGANFNLVFKDLADLTLAIRNGARFIGTNPDVTFPTERGQIPGSGSILALLSAASGVQPTVIGKPNAGMFEIAMHRLGLQPQETLMIGDRYDTDIAGAIKLGLVTVGVLTGISSRAEFESAEAPPHLICEGLPELLEHFKNL